MRTAANILAAILACSCLVCACDYGGQGVLDGGRDGSSGGDNQQQNECEQAAEVQMQGFDQVCAPRGTICCFCKCWNDGRKLYDTEAYASNQMCVCEEMQIDPPPCEGEVLTSAQACLADQTACRQEAMSMVTNAETGICTHTPL